VGAPAVLDPSRPDRATPLGGRGSASGLSGFLVSNLRRRGWLLVVAVTAIMARLPLAGTPLDPDEGGYAYIARHWAQGSALYGPGAWVDRPVGLMLVFRWVTDISYSATALRVAAALAAAVLAVAVACVSRALTGPGAGLVAGVLAGVVLAGPFIEGYQLNGELLAATIGTWGVAIAVWWASGRLSTGWLVLAGVLAGVAPLVKQSAVDTLLAVLAVAAARSLATRRARPVLLAVLGALLPFIAAVVWMVANGWSRAWFAVARFQADVARSQSLGDRVSAVAASIRHVAPDLIGLWLAAAVAAAVLGRRRRWLFPVPVWATAAVASVVTSPFGHPHYWVQAVGPLCVLAASVVPDLRHMSVRNRRLATAALTLALLLPLVSQASVLVRSPTSRAAALTGDRRLASDTDIAAWLKVHDPSGDSIYAFVGAAELYLAAGRETGYPYLWYEAVQRVPGALPLLEQWLSSQAGPRFVVLYQSPKVVEPKGPLAGILRAHYAPAATIDGYVVLERR
jgi:hypothetical protein